VYVVVLPDGDTARVTTVNASGTPISSRAVRTETLALDGAHRDARRAFFSALENEGNLAEVMIGARAEDTIERLASLVRDLVAALRRESPGGDRMRVPRHRIELTFGRDELEKLVAPPG
jgi:hypothetical protein